MLAKREVIYNVLAFECVIWQDSEKQQFAEELLAYTDAFNKASYSSIVAKGDVCDEAGESTRVLLLDYSFERFFMHKFCSLYPRANLLI
jgi:hypothetical protein